MIFARGKVVFIARDAYVACCLYFGQTVLKLFLSHVSSV